MLRPLRLYRLEIANDRPACMDGRGCAVVSPPGARAPCRATLRPAPLPPRATDPFLRAAPSGPVRRPLSGPWPLCGRSHWRGGCAVRRGPPRSSRRRPGRDWPGGRLVSAALLAWSAAFLALRPVAADFDESACALISGVPERGPGQRQARRGCAREQVIGVVRTAEGSPVGPGHGFLGLAATAAAGGDRFLGASLGMGARGNPTQSDGVGHPLRALSVRHAKEGAPSVSTAAKINPPSRPRFLKKWTRCWARICSSGSSQNRCAA